VNEMLIEVPILGRSKRELEPFDDWIVFRAVDADRTDAGLHLPDRAEARKKAIVVAVGPGKLKEDGTREPMDLAPGDWIVLGAHCPTPGGVDHTGEPLFLCQRSSVAARVVAPSERPS
jgi:chaperonin GroES